MVLAKERMVTHSNDSPFSDTGISPEVFLNTWPVLEISGVFAGITNKYCLHQMDTVAILTRPRGHM